MKTQRVFWIALASAVTFLLAGPALAESFGDPYGDAIRALFLYGLGYLGVLITLIVLALRRRKRGFLRVLALWLVVVVVYPLLDSGLMLYQKARVATAEIEKPAPDLREKSILYVAFDDRCYNTLCRALVELQAGGPLWAIKPDEAARLDFEYPIDLSEVTLVRWEYVSAEEGITLNESPDVSRRPEFDYLVISRRIFYLNRSSSVIDALPQTPKGVLLESYLSITDLAAPIEGHQLNIAKLTPDLLTFYNARKARKAPLFIEHTMNGSDRDWAWRERRADWFCGAGEGLTEAQYKCRRALR